MQIALLPKSQEFVESPVPFIVYSGGFGSGKSVSLCAKIVFLLTRYKNNRGYLCRKQLQDLKSTTLKTLLDGDGDLPPILPKALIKSHNKQDRRILLVNGSELFYGPMDKDVIKSMNLGFVAIDEMSEIQEDEFDAAVGRIRLSGIPIRQVFGVTNPDGEGHWIYKKFVVSPTPKHKFITASTLENKYLPKEYIENLQSTYFGHFYRKFVLGEWVSAEDIVYDNFDPKIHEIDSFHIPRAWKRFRSVDFGFTSPYVCLWGAIAGEGCESFESRLKPGDLIIYRQMYYTRRTSAVNAKLVADYSIYDPETKEPERFVNTICDWDSGDRADLTANGIRTEQANKDIANGIQKVRERLGNADSDAGKITRSRLYFMKDSLVEVDAKIRLNPKTGMRNNDPVRTEQEMRTWSWKKNATGAKDVPEDRYNHGMDALRYLVSFIDGKAIWKEIEFLTVSVR